MDLLPDFCLIQRHGGGAIIINNYRHLNGSLQDLRDPLIVLFEQSEEEDKLENNLEGMEAIPDVELLGFQTSTRSIHVISGA